MVLYRIEVKKIMRKKLKKIHIFFFPSKDNNYKAPFILSSFLLGIILALFLLKLISFVFLCGFPKFNIFADISKNVLVSLTNQTREYTGLTILNEDSRLNYAAYLKAQDMLNYDYFAHVSPSGRTPWSFIEEAGYNYQYAGENLAMDFLDSGEVFQAWLNSPGHKANIVNSKFKDIGMAVVTGEFQGRETTIVVQLFGTPLNVPSVAAKESSTPNVQISKTPQIKNSQPPVVVSSPITLYEYYRQKGQAMPSMSERALLYEKLGLGSASSYQGISWQNALLVNKLLGLDKKETPAQKEAEESAKSSQEEVSQPTQGLSTEATPTTSQLLPSPIETPTSNSETKPIFPAGKIKVSPPPNSSFSYRAVNFLVQNYDGITKNLFMIVFVVVFLSVCVDVAVKPSFKNTDLIIRGTIYSIVLLGLFFLDKSIIIKIIPHSFSIL